MYKVHCYLDNKLLFINQIPHLPRLKDTVRFGDGKYGIVTEVIWCMDETSCEGERVNIRVESEV